jgi:DNA-binding transcriptional LysR family regulator
MDWDGFRVLLAVVERGSFSAAGKALGISQPTAGRKVAALEASLGTRLLVRRNRGVALTPAGEQIVVEVRRMAESATAAARRASDRARVRVSATEGLGALWLPRRLLPLSRAEPTLRLEVVVDNAPVDLAGRRAEIALRLFRPREPDLVVRKVATVSFGLYAAPSYLAARGVPRSVGELAKHDIIGFGDVGVLPSYVRWLRKVVPEERFVFRTTSLLTQQEAARAGYGIVVGTRAILDADPRLRRVLPRARVPSMDAWLAVHSDVRKNPGVARVFDYLVELFAREPL